MYTEYKKMLQLQQEDVNGEKFSDYLKSTTPKEFFGDDSVNELYLWMYIDSKRVGNILAGCHLPAVRDMNNDNIPCGACLKLADKLDQAELYMRCPACGKLMNRLITQDFCRCALPYDSQESHVLLLCKAALGNGRLFQHLSKHNMLSSHSCLFFFEHSCRARIQATDDAPGS